MIIITLKVPNDKKSSTLVPLTFRQHLPDVLVPGGEPVEDPPAPDEEALLVDVLVDGETPHALPPQAQPVQTGAIGLGLGLDPGAGEHCNAREEECNHVQHDCSPTTQGLALSGRDCHDAFYWQFTALSVCGAIFN